MLFLGIDQHARQLTVSLRDQQGDVLLARQVSTRPGNILQFFNQLAQCCAQRVRYRRPESGDEFFDAECSFVSTITRTRQKTPECREK